MNLKEKNMMRMNDCVELVMMVGIPGSGKSSLTIEYEESGYRVHSSDLIRKELYGNEEIQGKASQVFGVLGQRVRADLKAGRSCVIDATNLSRRRRKAMLTTLAKHADRKTCIIVLASPSVCMERNAARGRKVPPETIYRMLCSFETPYYYEGWDKIEMVYNGEPYVFPREEAAELSQDNPHHTLTLGAHLDAARDYCVSHDFPAEVCEAAWYHDTGKLYTKRFMNKRGEPTEFAHFYGHENYSAYLYLCEKAGALSEDADLCVKTGETCVTSGEASDAAPSERILYIANLINWHMNPLNKWQRSPASEEKDRSLMGEAMYRDLMLLHQADLEAH